MKRILMPCAALLAVVACVDSNDTPFELKDEGNADGGVVPSTDASTDDAGDVSDAADSGDAESKEDAGARICSDDGFCYSKPPAGQSFRGVWGDGQGIVWAITAEKNILRWDGTAWSVHAQTDAVPSALWGSGPTDLWIGTATGLLHGTGATSAALVFAPVADLPGDATAPINSIWGASPTDIWAVGGLQSTSYPFNTRGRAVHYDGTAWSDDTGLSYQGANFTGVTGKAGSGVFVAGTRIAFRSPQSATPLWRAEGASNWTPIYLPPDPGGTYGTNGKVVDAIAMTSRTSVWLAGQTAAGAKASWLGTSADDGATFTWAYVPRPSWDRSIRAFWGFADNDLWAVGGVGLVTHWDGSDWQQAAIRVTDDPLGKALWSVWGTSSDDFWVVGDGVALHKTKAGKP